tara:strand:+ start:123 stop:308 length:186 start_codon:yes stop_codon:yes gene_type:complete
VIIKASWTVIRFERVGDLFHPKLRPKQKNVFASLAGQILSKKSFFFYRSLSPLILLFRVLA